MTTITLEMKAVVSRTDWDKAEVGKHLSIILPNSSRKAKVEVVQMQPGRLVGSLPTACEHKATIKKLKAQWLKTETNRLLLEMQQQSDEDETENFNEMLNTATKMARKRLDSCQQFLGNYHLQFI